MCGFFGVTGPSITPSHQEHRPLHHRGPDGTGEFAKETVYLRHYRLSILGGDAGRQPMVSENGRLCLVFNGEIYNYREIAREIGREDLIPSGDSRVLLELLAAVSLSDRPKFDAQISRLNGMYAFALYDLETRRVVLVRDRLGVKPLYYRLDSGCLYFGSEIKCLPGPRGLRQTAVETYLDFGEYPSGPFTFFDGIFQLPAANVAEFSDGRLNLRAYYNLGHHVQTLEDQKLSLEQYEDLLSESIRLRLRSDVPISLHFSGGTDSTALLLKTKEVWGWDYPLRTYTMAFSESEFDEFRFTQKTAVQVGIENFGIQLNAHEVPDLAESLQTYMDEPFGGIPTIAYFKMNQVERKDGYIVSIEGQGGDESLGGYATHVVMAVADCSESGQDLDLAASLAKFLGLTMNDALAQAKRLQSTGLHAHTDLTDFREGGSPREKISTWLRTIQLKDALEAKMPRTLRFNDRASMAVGREVRFPLLDYRLFALGMALPRRLMFSGGVSKSPLRTMVSRYLPNFAAPKRPISTPQTRWLRGELRDWALDQISALRKKHLIETRHFDRAEKFFEESNPDNSFFVWQLINLNLMDRSF